EGKKTLKPTTLSGYINVANKHIKNEIGYIKLNDLNHVILYKFLSNKQTELSASRITAIKNVINNSLNLAMRAGIIHSNPMAGVKLNPKAYNTDRKRETKALTKEEVKTLLEVTKGTNYYLPSLLAIKTGLRRGEALALTWDDIDFDKKTLSVNKSICNAAGKNMLTTPKTIASIRTIKLTHDVIAALHEEKQKQQAEKTLQGEYYNDLNLVCCKNDGSALAPKGFTSGFNHLLKTRAPFTVRFHDLRHTHATLLLEAGSNVKFIQERMGHSKISTTLDIYSHMTDNIEETSLKQFENLFS
nr:site-specific integrase [Turicibacter sp.]